MSLLEPGRLIRDEGLVGAFLICLNLLRDSEALTESAADEGRLPALPQATGCSCYYCASGTEPVFRLIS